jgi:alpha-N-acetylglucosaminidase
MCPKVSPKHTPRRASIKCAAGKAFPPTYWLDPSDPLFARLAKRFIEIYNATYGAGDYYLADAFNEMVPPIAEDGSDATNAQYGDSIANTAAANTQAEKVAALPPAVRDARLAAYGESSIIPSPPPRRTPLG